MKNQFHDARVGVIMGGWSAEHDVSLKSGTAVADALARRGYDVSRVVLGQNFRPSASELVANFERAKMDVAFLALHGRHGEDGCIQGLLELSQIPYTGAGVMASALAMDKVKSKELFLLHNVPTPPYYTVHADEDRSAVKSIHRHFGFPVIVKPRGEGSSLALTKAHNLEELAAGLECVFAYDDFALVERFIGGIEVNVAIVNGEVLGGIEIEVPGDLYDYDAKYTAGQSTYHMPARLPAARYQNVLNLARRAAEALDATGTVRVDLLVTPGENEYVLEVNTLPGMTETSLLPKIAEHAGMSFDALCEASLAGARLHSPQRQHKARRSAPVMIPRRSDETHVPEVGIKVSVA